MPYVVYNLAIAYNVRFIVSLKFFESKLTKLSNFRFCVNADLRLNCIFIEVIFKYFSTRIDFSSTNLLNLLQLKGKLTKGYVTNLYIFFLNLYRFLMNHRNFVNSLSLSFLCLNLRFITFLWHKISVIR